MTKSDDDTRTVLIKDPDLPWPGAFPYERLSKSLREKGYAEVSPSSTSERVKDALFDLMGRGPVDPDDRLAWDELRKLERRLPLDFLMYSLQASDDEVWSDALWELPMPVYMPDFRELPDSEPDYQKMISLPESFPPSPLPAAATLEMEMFIVEPVNIGPVSLDEFDVLGD